MTNQTIPAIYVYDIESGVLHRFFNCVKERRVFGEGTSNETVHYYGAKPLERFRVEIGSNPERVFHAEHSDTVVVWMYQANQKQAIDLILSYVTNLAKQQVEVKMVQIDVDWNAELYAWLPSSKYLNPEPKVVECPKPDRVRIICDDDSIQRQYVLDWKRSTAEPPKLFDNFIERVPTYVLVNCNNDDYIWDPTKIIQMKKMPCSYYSDEKVYGFSFTRCHDQRKSITDDVRQFIFVQEALRAMKIGISDSLDAINEQEHAKIKFRLPMPSIVKIIFNNPATIVWWDDGSKTVVKCTPDDTFNKQVGLSMAISRKYCEVSGHGYPRATFKHLIDQAFDMTEKTKTRKERATARKEKAKARKEDRLVKAD